MRLSDLGEFGLIRHIRKLSSGKSSSTLIGIGDDAAAFKLSGGCVMLATTDLLLEHVHFDLSFTDLYSLGWKSAAVNLSDIAAMGGSPRFCLTALGIPRRTDPGDIHAFYRGFNHLLRSQKVVLIGGDTCSSPGGFFISVTAIGEARPGRIVSRSGAKPGDRIFVTGALGDSAAGLELLKAGMGRGSRASNRGPRRPSRRTTEHLMMRHLRPSPRVAEGRMIAAAGCASAMIDLSDGLSSDLAHICEQSRVGAVIHAARIPLTPGLVRASAELPREALDYALSGGEDYELLFTVPGSRLRKLRALRLPVTEIGEITAGRSAFLLERGGGMERLAPAGYDHFPQHRGERKKGK